jgi:hypothetical protein
VTVSGFSARRQRQIVKVFNLGPASAKLPEMKDGGGEIGDTFPIVD